MLYFVARGNRPIGGIDLLRAPLLAGLVTLILCAPASGQAQEPSDKAVPDPEGPPPVSSPWRTWQFNGSLERVREQLEALMKEDGLAFKEQNKATGSFVTDLVEFDDKKFGVEVSIPPPKASPKYPWFQLNSMTSGRFGLEGRLSALSESQTRLDLRALLEIRAMDKKIRALRWIPRYSNGAVEQLYFTRLSMSLLQSSSTAQAPAR